MPLGIPIGWGCALVVIRLALFIASSNVTKEASIQASLVASSKRRQSRKRMRKKKRDRAGQEESESTNNNASCHASPLSGKSRRHHTDGMSSSESRTTAFVLAEALADQLLEVVVEEVEVLV